MGNIRRRLRNIIGYRMPTKGQLIKIKDAIVEDGVHKDLICRVLLSNKFTGEAKLLVMNYTYRSALWSSQQAIDSGNWDIQTIGDWEVRSLKYANSTADTNLNSTFYNRLHDDMKAAIKPADRTQYVYDTDTWWSTPDDPDFTIHTVRAQEGGGRYQDYALLTTIPVGQRNIYMLDMHDIYEYINPAHGATVQGTAINKIFFDANDPTPAIANTKRLWLQNGVIQGQTTSPNRKNYYPTQWNSYYGAE